MSNIKLPSETLKKFSEIADLEEYKKAVFEQVKVDDIDLPANRVLCAVYIESDKFASGLFKAPETIAESIWQGKPALVLKLGPTAFLSGGEWNFEDFRIEPGDWITSKIGNTSQIEINRYPCRIVADSFVETRVRDPRMVTS